MSNEIVKRKFSAADDPEALEKAMNDYLLKKGVMVQDIKYLNIDKSHNPPHIIFTGTITAVKEKGD
jgi:hypothetical protein